MEKLKDFFRGLMLDKVDYTCLMVASFVPVFLGYELPLLHLASIWIVTFILLCLVIELFARLIDHQRNKHGHE